MTVAAMLSLLVLPAVPAGADGGGHRDRHRPPPIEYVVDTESLPFEPLAGFEDARREWGVLRGAGWRIEIPADWNGELVMWAHGFRGTDTRLFFNAEEVPFRQWLLEHGYAWAASTYSENDYTVGVAVEDTRRLVSHFRRVAREHPDRTYIAGASMGGHVTAESVERYPRLYDGAMPVCGVLGDYELFDYFLDFNVAAQQLALGQSAFPPGDDYATVTAQEIKRALEAAPGTWPAALNETGEALKQLVELRSGGDRPNFDEAWVFWNSFPEFGSGVPGNFLFDLGAGDGTVGSRDRVAVDNTRTFYETDLVPGPSNPVEEELNASVVRVRAERKARLDTRLAPSPELSGRIRVPVLTMHNLGDMFVPFSMEVEYEQNVSARHRSSLLVQRAIRGVSHCGFTTAEYEQGFADLVAWVEDGTKPEGDAVGDPAAVAAPDFGCRFTDPTPGAHLLATPCPAAGG
jgi:pimeloyl-ACP methyl ester carboxylesterase